MARSTHARRERHRERARDKAAEAAAVSPSPEIIRAQNDFAFFAEYVTRNSPDPAALAEHHLEWFKHFITEQDTKCLLRIGGPNIDLLAPRGSGKSTQIGLFIAWLIGIHAQAKKVIQIIYISYSLSAARAKSSTIKNIIQSAEYREIFPCVRPHPNKFADDHWCIDYEFAGIKSSGAERFTMYCAGSAGTIASKRASIIFYDDPIKGADQIANPSVREKMERNWYTVIRPTLLEGGRIISIGTRFRPDDIHVTTFCPAKGWVQIEQRAIFENEDGTERSYWPSMWSLEYLQGLRKDDIQSFSFQYLNQIIPLDEIGLHPDWICFEDIPDEFDSYAVGIDLASSLKTKADFTVLMLCGRRDNKFYFLDYRRGKWQGNVAIANQLLDLYEEWHEPGIPFTVYCEAISYQASFQGDFTHYIVNEKEIYDIRCVPWRMKGDKLAHLMSVSGLYANGAIAYNKYRFHKKDDVIRELVEFGSMQHDDGLDSTCIVLQGMGARRRLQAA
jgi:predicted phage terminase large subunit-like protein